MDEDCRRLDEIFNVKIFRNWIPNLPGSADELGIPEAGQRILWPCTSGRKTGKGFGAPIAKRMWYDSCT